MNLVNEGRVVLAYDPGKVTGWALWRPDTEAFANGQTDGRFAFYGQIEGVIASGVRLEVVGEKFIITGQTAKKTQQLDALYINGVMDYWSTKHGFPLTLQTPQQAKGFATDAKLKAVGWHTPTPGGHANDATRHLLTYLCGNRAELGGKDLLDRIVEGLGL